MLLSWKAGSALFWADLTPTLSETDSPSNAHRLSLLRQGSEPLTQAASIFRTAPQAGAGVWVVNGGTVEVSGWENGVRQVGETRAIAPGVQAINVSATDRAPLEVAFGLSSSISATTGIDSLDIARRQDVFAPMLRRFENFVFVDISVSSDTSCNKVSIRDLFNGRRNAPVLDGVTYMTSVMTHATGEPGNTRLFAQGIRVFARRANSTEWKEGLEFNVPPEVTSAAVVASRSRGILLI